MYAVRRWSVRHSRFLEVVYRLFGGAVAALDPLWRTVGYGRVEKPVAAVERAIKGFLFDCRMCGRCVLGDTGMSCPMNCSKQLRNGPCGGVRAGGMCEVTVDMRCVWVEAWEGAGRMRRGVAIREVQPPVDNSLAGTSAWLRAAREAAAKKRAARDRARSGAMRIGTGQ